MIGVPIHPSNLKFTNLKDLHHFKTFLNMVKVSFTSSCDVFDKG